MQVKGQTLDDVVASAVSQLATYLYRSPHNNTVYLDNKCGNYLTYFSDKRAGSYNYIKGCHSFYDDIVYIKPFKKSKKRKRKKENPYGF